MKLIVTGFSNSGKTTVFNALTGQELETTAYSTSISSEVDPHQGIVKIPDSRIDKSSPALVSQGIISRIDHIIYGTF